MKNSKKNKDNKNLTYILGLDLGPGSVGWAVIRCDKKNTAPPKELVACGVRRFDAGVSGDIEKGRDEPNSVARRQARGPRRNTWRQQWRMRKLFRLLSSYKMLPEVEDNPDARHKALLKLDEKLRTKYLDLDNPSDFHLLPYILRAKALDRKLTLQAFGRAIYQLAMRRGYKSNRKTQGDDSERGVVSDGISKLEESIQEAGCRTLGEYFASVKNPDRPEDGQRMIRGKWTARQMFEDEFGAIWKAQKKFHKSALTDEMKNRIFKAIFDQRPLKSQKNLIGRCSIFPKKRGAPVACQAAQEFRLLQKLNNLEAYAPDGVVIPFGENLEIRNQLKTQLAENGDLTWAAVKKCLGFKKSKELGRDYTFNLQEGGEKKLTGNRTAKKFRDINPDLWDGLENKQKEDLVDEFLSFESEEALARRLNSHWGYSEEEAERLSRVYLEQGYSSHCKKGLRLLNQRLTSGQSYSTAMKELKEELGISAEEKTIHDLLPALNEIPDTSEIKNPSVMRTLSELRKVVNEIIRMYGKPFRIRVELARDLKNPRKRREEHSKNRDRNQKAREKAKDRILAEIRDEGIATRRRDQEKLLLADECHWCCPYCGISLGGVKKLFSGGEIQVEHIIPRSVSFDNSFGNKTLSCQSCNQAKGGKNPYEAFSGDEKHWDEILTRVKNFGGDFARHKLRLFQLEKLDHDFEEKLLNDTRHSSVAAKNYLGHLYGGEIDPATSKRIVQCSPGQCTALLRGQWNLNRILGGTSKKSREDHRHHAIDAIVIALTSPAILQKMSKSAKEAETSNQKLLRYLDSEPWKGFENQVREKVDRIVVSSRVNKKLNGSLHKDTILSHPKGKRSDGSPIHHVRKPLQSLSKNEVDAIVDPKIRELVVQKLEAGKGGPDKVFADPNNLPQLVSKSDPKKIVDIKSVRIRKSDKPMPVGKGSARRYVNPGSNHHMEIVAHLDKDGNEKKWEGILVSRFHANERKRNGLPIIQKDHGKDRLFKFSLAGSEHVLMNFDGESEKVYRLNVLSEGSLEFVLHTDARPITIRKKIPGARVRCSPNRLREMEARKVSVDPAGTVRLQND